MMHRIIRDHLEEVLTGLGSAPEHPAGKHLAECEECRDAVTAMRAQAAILQQWRLTDTEMAEVEPRAGFYARVLERIEAQGPGSVWALFFDTLFARRIAMASLALALLLGVYVISSEQMSEPQTASVDGLPQAVFSGDVFSDNAQPRLVTAAPDQDAVLVNLVTYREQ
jgi:predicted anti-sigma-YlaC factor YlaD